jgi:hypothetical protein
MINAGFAQIPASSWAEVCLSSQPKKQAKSCNLKNDDKTFLQKH